MAKATARSKVVTARKSAPKGASAKSTAVLKKSAATKSPAPAKSTKSAAAAPKATAKKAAPAPAVLSKTVAPKAPAKAAPFAKPSAFGSRPASKPGDDFEFIGAFPVRRLSDNRKNDLKKSAIGPVFSQGAYKAVAFSTPLGQSFVEEFKSVYMGKHAHDGLQFSQAEYPAGNALVQPASVLIQNILEGKVDMAILNMKEVPMDLPDSLTIGASLKREDPRDALVTRATYGAIQELPRNARISAASKRRVMQIRSYRPDLEIIPSTGNVIQRLEQVESGEIDALVVAWASLRRLNLSPRYYVSLPAEVMVPAPCQGSVGVICRTSDETLVSKLRYIEDSEASWSSRCERAFLQKMGSRLGMPIGALAHRKGTQDPWILDIVVGDPQTGEVLKHREIGTSRCKPESLADKAFSGILAKGARKFLYL
jgi:hydroxymethylbilane synthase